MGKAKQKTTKIRGVSQKYKTLPLEEVVAMSTKRPLLVVQGPGTCFHQSNRVSIVKIKAPPGGEMTSATVAEVWPAERDIDLADGALITHAFNNFGFAVESLQECFDILEGLVEGGAKKISFMQLLDIRKAKRVLNRCKRVHMPVPI